MTNTANVSADNSAIAETNTDSDEIMQTTTVRSLVDVRVNSKTVDRSPVNLGEDFVWTIEVENVEDSSVPFGVAEGVVVSDTLPTGMVLTGPPVIVGPAGGDCGTAGAGATSFSCLVGDAGGVDGTMAIGEIITITVPVRVNTVTSDPQTFTNTASIVANGSFDADPDNNEGAGDVVVNSGTISGEIFRDFNDDGTKDPGDTNVNVVTMTLTGTDLNGNTVTRTVTTSNGTYSFGLLPEGDYTVTRGSIAEPFITDGQNTPGTSGGPLFTGLTSPTIMLAGNGDEPMYDFAVVPQARIGLAKQVVGTPTLNPDGTYDVLFRFVIENFSLEELNTVSLDDTLEGGAPAFGTFTTATTGMARGSYTVLTPPSAACGTATAGFTAVSYTHLTLPTILLV